MKRILLQILHTRYLLGTIVLILVATATPIAAQFAPEFLPLPIKLAKPPSEKPYFIVRPTEKDQLASESAIVSLLQIPTQPSPSVPWGTTEKVGDHLYRTFVGQDSVMGTPDEILAALNSYRRNHGISNLQQDENLCHLAMRRAQEQDRISNLDAHKGLIDYMDDPNHWQELNIRAIGENASFGYVLSGVHLIEWVFDADVEHRDNQLNPNWNLACAGVSGTTVDIIFGQR